MDELHEHDGLTEFNRRLARAGRGVFLLDYDGTLAPFSADIRNVQPYPGVAVALDELIGSGRTRVIVVTGRCLQTAPPVLGTRTSLEIWGSHGRERRLPDGRYEVARIDNSALRALAIAAAWSAEIVDAGGYCEIKPGSLAVHWRGATPAQVERLQSLVRRKLYEAALDAVLVLKDFDGGIELHAPGFDKGQVVRTVLDETDPDVPTAYLGDDFADEAAFVALPGSGLSILVRPEFRDSNASLWIRPPEGLIWLLGLWRDTLRTATAVGDGR